MPRPASISYEDFVVAANELRIAGEKLTFAAAKLKLGGGSYDVLKRYIDRYAAESKATEESPGVPVNLLGGMQAWFDEAKQAARQQAYAELDDQFQALEAQRVQTQLQVTEAGQLAAAAEALSRERAGRIEQLIEERARLQGQLDQAQARGDRLALELGQAEAARATESSVLRAHAQQAAAQTQDAQTKFLAALDLAQTRFDAVQQRTMQALDDARTVLLSKVEAALAEALKAVNQHVGQIARGVGDLAQEQRISAALQSQIKGLQDDLRGSHLLATKSAEEGAAARAERDLLLSRLAELQAAARPADLIAKSGARAKRGGSA